MTSAMQTFPIKSPPRSASVICAGLAIIPIGSFFIMLQATPQMMGLNVFLNGGILAVIILLGVSIRKTRFEISQDGLRIRGDMWGKTLSWSDLDLAKARIVSFEAEPGLKPKWKTCGTALPGYAAGWFRLYDKSKALIFLSDKMEAVCVPTRKDFVLLLSAENNSALLKALTEHEAMAVR